MGTIIRKLLLVVLVIFCSINSVEAARDFTAASTYGVTTNFNASRAPCGGHPCTIAGWFKTTDTTNNRTVYMDYRNATERINMGPNAVGAGKFYAYIAHGGLSALAETTNTISTTGWNHFCARYVSPTSHNIILNGDLANKGTSTTNVNSFPDFTTNHTIRIGFDGTNTLPGHYAWFMEYEGTFSEDQCIALYRGANPARMMPSGAEVWPLWGRDSPEVNISTDQRAGQTATNLPLTLNGSPAVSPDGPPVTLFTISDLIEQDGILPGTIPWFRKKLSPTRWQLAQMLELEKYGF